jgi:2-phosphoglycerate kinase
MVHSETRVKEHRKQAGDIRRRLDHIYWIGGSPCSGKSSIVEHLIQRSVCQSYNCDDAFQRHAEQITPEAQPTLYKVTHITWEELWMQPVDVLVQDAIRVYHEEWNMIVEDLLALPNDMPIIAEGTALLPALVHDVITDPQQAIWVVPTKEFQRECYPQRGTWVQEIVSQCTDPEQALRNWMDRDVAFACWVSEEARRRRLRLLVVDGERRIDENAAVVEAHFGFT